MDGMNDRDYFNGHKNSAVRHQIDETAFNIIQKVLQRYDDIKQ